MKKLAAEEEKKEMPAAKTQSKEKDKSPLRVYVAGPLFNKGDRFVQAEVAKYLERAGFSVFLPQRDGVESTQLFANFIAQGLTEQQAQRKIAQTIFDIDVYQVWKADALVSTVAGIEPDSGTVSETALAFAMGKGIVLYGAEEIRTFSDQLQLNPLLSELASVPGEIVNNPNQLPSAVVNACLLSRPVESSQLSASLRDAIKRGRALWKQFKKKA